MILKTRVESCYRGGMPPFCNQEISDLYVSKRPGLCNVLPGMIVSQKNSYEERICRSFHYCFRFRVYGLQKK
jgi:hypothetical protein